ncbi:DUF5908 family protein [Lacinutrix chionoecetis]
MTVIIKELVVKTSIVENHNRNPDFDKNQFKNDIVKACLQKIKKTSRKQAER